MKYGIDTVIEAGRNIGVQRQCIENAAEKFLPCYSVFSYRDAINLLMFASAWPGIREDVLIEAIQAQDLTKTDADLVVILRGEKPVFVNHDDYDATNYGTHAVIPLKSKKQALQYVVMSDFAEV